MGFSAVIAGGILIFSLSFLITSFYLTSIEIYDSFLTREGELRSGVMKNPWNTAIMVDSVSLVSEHQVEVKVTNRGSTGIPESKFRHMDLIVVYYSKDGDLQVAKYLSYSPSCIPETWCVSSVNTAGVEGESLNPICPCPATGKGIWDPGETLVIRGVFDSPANVSMPVHTYVSTPWGVGGYR